VQRQEECLRRFRLLKDGFCSWSVVNKDVEEMKSERYRGPEPRAQNLKCEGKE